MAGRRESPPEAPVGPETKGGTIPEGAVSRPLCRISAPSPSHWGGGGSGTTVGAEKEDMD